MRSLGFFGCRPLTDLSPLKDMKNLGYINLQYCSKLSDLTPLSEMTELQMIELRDINVASLAALSDLKKLKILGLSGLKIRDMSPVYGIKGLWFIVGGKEMVGPIHTNLPDCWIGRWDKHSRGAGR